MIFVNSFDLNGTMEQLKNGASSCIVKEASKRFGSHVRETSFNGKVIDSCIPNSAQEIGVFQCETRNGQTA